MKKIAINIFISIIVISLLSCGGGGGGSATISQNSNTTSQISAVSLIDDFTAITTGDPAEFNNTKTIAGIYKSLLTALSQWSPIRTAYAFSNCSVITTSRTIMVSTAGGDLKSFSVINDAKTETSLSISGNQECVTSVQDSGDYVTFLSDNIFGKLGKCDILFLRKKDAFVYCLRADISSLINGVTLNSEVAYSIGAKDTSAATTEYRANYASNSGGYKAVITRNGRYLFSEFSTTINNKNYIGVSRFTLNKSSKPTEKILWLKEKTINNNIYSYLLRGFIGLENGDAIVDYVENYNPNDQNYSTRPIDAATREYIAVNEATLDPSAQPKLTLFKGRYGYNIYGWGPEGDLLTYLYSNDPTRAIDVTGNPTPSYTQNNLLPIQYQENIYNISSDPNDAGRVIYVTMQPSRNTRVGPNLDLLKVTINSNGTTASVGNVEYVGATTSYYPFVVLGSKIYSYARSTSYTKQGGATQTTNSAIISFSLNNLPNDQREVYAAGVTFTYSVFPSNSSLFVLEGFNGYFGGNLQGTNKIYQLDVSAGNETVTDINLGDVAAGTFSLKALSINSVTNQVQMSGEKRDVMFGPATKQWFGFVDATGIKNLSLVSSLSAINYDSPVISLRYSNGTKPTFSN